MPDIKKPNWEITDAGDDIEPFCILQLETGFLRLEITPYNSKGFSGFEVDITQASDGQIIKSTGIDGLVPTLDGAKEKALDLAVEVLEENLVVLKQWKGGNK